MSRASRFRGLMIIIATTFLFAPTALKAESGGGGGETGDVTNSSKSPDEAADGILQWWVKNEADADDPPKELHGTFEWQTIDLGRLFGSSRRSSDNQ